MRKISFTGSTEVGKLLMAQCASTVKKLSLELGGNAPFIVFDDADLDAAVEGAIVSKYRNTGQTCVCANRLLVQAAVYDDVRREALRGGRRSSRSGPVSSRASRRARSSTTPPSRRSRRTSLTRSAKGATVLRGGHRTRPASTLLRADGADRRHRGHDARATRKRSVRWLRSSASTTEADAIRLANDTEFGLAAYFYGRDIGRIWRVAEALEYGIVGVNTGLISTEVAPFGGVKESGSRP